MQSLHVALVIPGMRLAAGMVHALIEHLDKVVSASTLLNSTQELKRTVFPHPTARGNEVEDEKTTLRPRGFRAVTVRL